MQWKFSRIGFNHGVFLFYPFLLIRSCDNVEPWAAFIIGTIGGCVYILINKLLAKLEIDDPVDAVPIHLVISNNHKIYI